MPRTCQLRLLRILASCLTSCSCLHSNVVLTQAHIEPRFAKSLPSIQLPSADVARPPRNASRGSAVSASYARSQRRLLDASGGSSLPHTEEDEAERVPWPDHMLGDTWHTDFVGSVKIAHTGVASCRGIRTVFRPRLGPERLILRDLGEEDIQALGRLQPQAWPNAPNHIVVWMAKNGLGNTVRAFLSAFFFAFLSGRQLLRYSAGSHGRVMRSLCHGFSCPYINVLHHKGRLPPSAASMCHGQEGALLGDPRPIVVADCDYISRFWVQNSSLQKCVLDSLGCQHQWCAMSRAVLLLLGEPTEVLDAAIRRSMVLSPWASLASPRAAGGSTSEGAAAGGYSGGALAEGNPTGLAMSSFLSDEDAVTTGSLGPATASLRLKFDIALHIRTLSKCVESGKQTPECRDEGLAHAEAVANSSSTLKRYTQASDWYCISRLLSFLQFWKEEKGDSEIPFFTTYGDQKKLFHFLNECAEEKRGRSETSGLWTVRRARRSAQKNADLSFPLSIFLATDSEALRPLFVEFLTPYGDVIASKGGVVHLDRGTSNETLRMATVAEFYLLSKASILLSTTRRTSSFLQGAALYGNGTLIRRARGDCAFHVYHMAQASRN